MTDPVPTRRARSAAGASGLVYSTDAGRMCPACRQALVACVCAAQAAARPLGDGVVRVSRDAKGRAGKVVTVVRGLPLTDADLADLGKRLRTVCGAGGTVKDGVAEVQGDHVQRVLDFLAQQGFKAKRVGA